jgi:ATP-binding cassette subfamily B protein/subfamily B ATP-binding cassette protein MsbA
LLPRELKILIQELKPHKLRLSIVAVTGVLTALATNSQALFTKQLLDNMSAAKTDGVVETLAILLFVMLVMVISRYFHIFNMNFIGELVVQGIRQKLQQKFLRLNSTFYSKTENGGGGLISRILNDVNVIFHGMRLFADVVREPLIFIGAFSILIYLNWKLTLTIFTVVPIVLWSTRQISRSLTKYANRGQEELEVMTSTIKESIDGVRVIQSFNMESDMEQRFKVDSDRYLKARKKVHAMAELSSPLNEYVMILVSAAVILFFATEIEKGRSTPGDFLGFIHALLQMSTPFKKIQESFVRIQESMTALRRTLAILEDPNEVPQQDANLDFPKSWNKILYRDVNFSYGQSPLLQNFNLEIKKGEVVAFVGASGSGKSTVVNLLERFFDPTSGNISIDDTDLRRFSLESLRQNIALVTQDVFLFNDTIENNIWFGNKSRVKNDVPTAAKAAHAEEFILKNSAAYQSQVGDRGGSLSGGEKQRISIARAMFKDAPIIILDEATSALDSQSERDVQKGLDELMKGRTVLVIAHRLSTVAKADKIVVMKNGQIVEMGTHQDLLKTKGEYYKLYQIQFEQIGDSNP